MISTKRTATKKQFCFDNQPNFSTKKNMEARWQTAKGKLVYRWVEV